MPWRAFLACRSAGDGRTSFAFCRGRLANPPRVGRRKRRSRARSRVLLMEVRLLPEPRRSSGGPAHPLAPLSPTTDSSSIEPADGLAAGSSGPSARLLTRPKKFSGFRCGAEPPVRYSGGFHERVRPSILGGTVRHPVTQEGL